MIVKATFEGGRLPWTLELELPDRLNLRQYLHGHEKNVCVSMDIGFGLSVPKSPPTGGLRVLMWDSQTSGSLTKLLVHGLAKEYAAYMSTDERAFKRRMEKEVLVGVVIITWEES